MSAEIWKPVVGHEGAYEVSDLGRVRSVDRVAQVLNRWGSFSMRSYQGKMLRATDNGVGYLCVHLCGSTGRESKLVHRLVAEAFVEPLHGKAFVNHRDGGKLNNQSFNLEWCTRAENMQHAQDNNLVENHVVAVVGVCLATGRETRYEKQIDAEIALSGTGRPSSAVHHCLVGKKKTAYGHVWSLA